MGIETYTLHGRNEVLALVFVRDRLCGPARVAAKSPACNRSHKRLDRDQSLDPEGQLLPYLGIIESVDEIWYKSWEVWLNCFNATCTLAATVSPTDQKNMQMTNLPPSRPKQGYRFLSGANRYSTTYPSGDQEAR